ncbi:hypothetical protein CANCADRAFT_131233 [Tortispora caseinolytica NRRL Y-17796]|uniref:ABC transporter domain-containing protein n=1 Tax=Tortispora caseinolytica NRRL Y-17796 TaxID=767744 RepID=A0A1E4TB23_9ASCO|nr:hypothetical protein CANCADRAFT_131233 [Tortispora caseinolytica NRRL Y-17796]
MWLLLLLVLNSWHALADSAFELPVYHATTPPDDCPPCFNCLLPSFKCQQFSKCNELDGRCICPPGFAGENCGTPACGSLAQGPNRHPRKDDSPCECDEGWDGIICNVCNSDAACDALMPEGVNGTCYKGGLAVKENHQICDITNRKILDILDGKIPRVTFSCNGDDESCNFQFWIDQRESFYCGLENCSAVAQDGTLEYDCQRISCDCVPGRMLCGENGSIDLTDFLQLSIKGPGQFTCTDNGTNCDFSEPQMNNLIKAVFGDSKITMHCNSGECLHYTEVPGYSPPQKTVNQRLVILSLIAVSVSIVIAAGLIIYFARTTWLPKSGGSDSDATLPSSSEMSKLLVGHLDMTLAFSNIGYSVQSKPIISGITGIARPRELTAIIGGSGAGKTTLLDILACRNKAGSISGDVYLNGSKIVKSSLYSAMGFVDQDDILMPTLTVYETVLNAAELKLPSSVPRSAKSARVLEILAELGIFHIKDQRIGNQERRGISGGERKRVAIACELVTGPSILFLDEPTSGLDSYSSHQVVESIVRLAKEFNCTVIMTIHQPRSNIFALFDRLLLLGKGNTVYSGACSGLAQYFEGIGYECPPGYNIAEYLIDLTMGGADFANHSASQGNYGQIAAGSNTDNSESSNSNLLSSLVNHFSNSSIAKELTTEIDALTRSASETENGDNSSGDHTLVAAASKSGFWIQFKVLSSRAFINIYRSPLLLSSHYVMAVILAGVCGSLYYNVTNDISGFQNRLGLFFFLLTLFGFSTLTSLNLFAAERALFLRERAKGYYSPFAYFASKVLFDVIPLRVFPPLLLGLVIYPLVGLTTEGATMPKFLLVLTLFNLTAAAIFFFIGIVVRDGSVAILFGILVMLFGLLFAGLFLNHDSIPKYVLWMQDLSIFHYAYEAMIVNEVRYLTLVEKKFGLSIDVPGATILSTFGFDAGAFWTDVYGLITILLSFFALAYLGMYFFLVESR